MESKDYLKDEMAALKIAIENEHKVRNFYLENAKKIENHLAKKAFIFLADEELKHVDTITEFNKSINNEETPDIDTGAEDEATTRVKDFFSANMSTIAEKAVVSEEDVKVYELGLEMEEKGYEFYKKAAEKAEHDNIKKLFEFLMKEENAHYHLISNIINYLKDPSEWNQAEEQWFFEG